MTDQIVIPTLTGMEERHRAPLVSFAQSIKPYVDKQVKSIVGATGTQATQLAALNAQIAAFRQQLLALQQQVNNIIGGGAGGFPVVGTFAKAVPIGSFPCAVYESSAGIASPADNADLTTLYGTLGLATAAAPGGKVLVTLLGDVRSPAWAWTPDAPVYVDTAGALTQVQPTNAVIVGYATTPTSIFVNVSYPSKDSGTVPTTMQADLIIADHTQLLFHEEIVMQAGQEILIGEDADLVSVQ